MTTTADAIQLLERASLYKQLSVYLCSMPKSAEMWERDPRLADEPEMKELLGDILQIRARFIPPYEKLISRLYGVIWEHLEHAHGLVRGDIIECEPRWGVSRIIVAHVEVLDFENAKFELGGPAALVSGKPGKKWARFTTDGKPWKKIGHFDGELRDMSGTWTLW